jgi:hypothetical protein
LLAHPAIFERITLGSPLSGQALDTRKYSFLQSRIDRCAGGVSARYLFGENVREQKLKSHPRVEEEPLEDEQAARYVSSE